MNTKGFIVKVKGTMECRDPKLKNVISKKLFDAINNAIIELNSEGYDVVGNYGITTKDIFEEEKENNGYF